MNHYETVFILTPVLSDVQMKEAVEKFKTLLTDNGAEIVNEENWGLRKLAYPIEKKSTGFYQLLEFNADPAVIEKLQIQFRRDERVIRFLTFKMDKFEAGTLKAIALVDGKKVKTDIVRTPEKVQKLKMWIDESNRPAEAGCNDLIFLYIAGVDKNGTISPDFIEEISLSLPKGVELMNTEPILAELGIASALVRIGNQTGSFKIKATSSSKKTTSYTLKIKK